MRIDKTDDRAKALLIFAQNVDGFVQEYGRIPLLASFGLTPGR